MSKSVIVKFRIKGISLRIDNIFYVDVEPSPKMKIAYEKFHHSLVHDQIDNHHNPYYWSQCGECFLNIARNIDKEYDDFNLSSYFEEYGWLDIPYKCSQEEKKAVLDFINEWKDKIPENPDGMIYGDDTEYVNALPDDIQWKKNVLR